MPTRLAWIGTAHIHTPGFSNEVLKRGILCAGVYDHDANRAKASAEKLGGPVRELADIAEDASVDGFVMCCETVRHLDLIRYLLAAGKPVFIEKPMGFNGAQSREIMSLLEEHDIPFQTGYFNRGRPVFQGLKRKVDEGFFGQVTRVRGSVCHNGAINGWFDGEWRWMADRKQAGVGAFGDLGTHLLDLMMWMFGNVAKVTGAFSEGTNRYPGCEELGEALLKFESGTLGTLAASWDDVADPIRLMVTGTKGMALAGEELKLAGPDGKFSVEELPAEVPAGFSGFLDFLEGKRVELVTAREAAGRDAVMDAIYRGAESSSWVEL